MHKYILLGSILISHLSFSQTNDSIRTFIEKSFDLIESNSINTQNIDSIKSWLYTESQKFTSMDDIAPLYEEVFKRLNDHHGNLKYKGKTYGWHVPLKIENTYIKSRLKNEKSVVSTVLNGEFGYIRIPGNNDFAFKKVDSIASDIVAHINMVNSAEIKGWIIDLRLNTGGNMYPILLGLKDFIGDEVVFGGFRNSKDESSGKWEITDSKMLIDGIELTQKSHVDRPIPITTPLVILTSACTASAGELTAISLIGRPYTTIIGEPTANYTTAVQGFKINEYAGINLSTDYVADRNNKVYKSSIVPDLEVIGGDDLGDMLKDEKINRALEFLRRQRRQDQTQQRKISRR